MRILLVKPAFARILNNAAYLTYPLGLMYVAATLQELGHTVQIWHDDVSNQTAPPIPHCPPGFKPLSTLTPGPDVLDPLALKIDTWQPDVIGVGYTTIDRIGAHAVAQLANERGIRVVAGGVHPSLLPDGELKPNGPFDAVVVGEGDNWETESVYTGELDWFFSSEQWVHSCFDMISPAREAVIGWENYSPYLRGIVQTQRGCPYNCGYCAASKVFGRKVRTRDAVNVRREVETLGVRSGRIIDDSFFVVKEHSRQVCIELENVDYSWVCDMALQDATNDALQYIARGGGTCINVGIESASPRWRDLSGKKVRAGEPENLIQRASDNGIGVVYYFMVGFPGETVDEINMTLDYAQRLKDLGAKPCVSLVMPYPKTRLWDVACEWKDMTNPDWSEFIHQNSQIKLAACTDSEWADAVQRGNEIN